MKRAKCRKAAPTRRFFAKGSIMSKSSYQLSLEMQLREIGKTIAVAKARLAAAAGPERTRLATEWLELEQRFGDISARLRSLEAGPNGFRADLSAELQRVLNGLADSVGDWVNDIDRRYGRLH
jgi:hypothetical protein